MGMGAALDVIDQLASRGVFRVKDLNPYRLSHNWLPLAGFLQHATPHGRGVWSHPQYQPSRYELIQIRFPKAVFSSTIERDSMVILRTRRLELDVVTLHPEGRALPLRVHNAERAHADLIARMRPPRVGGR